MSTTPKGPDVGTMTSASLGQAMDTMDFMKRACSSFSVPTQFAPTLDVEELDKRIKDLRTVEQWLALNQSLLRNTIQGLEIQRGTLGAINAMSESFSKAMQPPDEDTARTVARHAAEAAARQVSASADRASAIGPQQRSEPTGAPFDWSPSSMPSSAAFNTGSAPSPAGAAAAAAAELSAMSAIDPLGWWELLQNNFQQIAQAATGSAAAKTPAQQADSGSANRAAASASGKPSKAPDKSGQPSSRKDAPSKAAKSATCPRQAKS